MKKCIVLRKPCLKGSRLFISAKKLAKIYDSMDRGYRIDPVEKERLYALAAKYPQIHYQALIINRKRLKRG